MGEILPDGTIQGYTCGCGAAVGMMGHHCDWQREQQRRRAEADAAAEWTVVREEGVTFCEEPHPVRLGRNPRHYDNEPSDRRMAINDGRKGYRCPGGEEHLYPVWIVYDAHDERRSNAGIFDRYAEAIECRNRLRAAQRALLDERAQ